MNYSFLITASLALAWMFSPDSLVLQGNGAGSGMNQFLPALAFGGIISSACISLLHHPELSECSGQHFPPATFIIASRLSLVFFLPTGMLVTAGFTFNETFVYWFPNFAFSFLLLAFVAALHLISEKIAAAAQPLFIGITLLCLLLLSIFGIAGRENLIASAEPFPLSVHLSITTLVIFLGYDSDSVNNGNINHRRIIYWVTIGTGYLLLTLWAIASVSSVNPEKLAESTIPYAVVANSILGQPGRIIMGVAIISGTLSCVNALFLLANRAMVVLTKHVFLRLPAGAMLEKRIYPFIFSVLISSFMAAGMAGSGNLEIYIRGALMLWLLSVGVHCLMAARTLRTLGKTMAGFGYVLSMFIISSTFYLIYSHPRSIQILGFCCFVLVTSFLISRSLLYFNRQTINTET